MRTTFSNYLLTWTPYSMMPQPQPATGVAIRRNAIFTQLGPKPLSAEELKRCLEDCCPLKETNEAAVYEIDVEKAHKMGAKVIRIAVTKPAGDSK